MTVTLHDHKPEQFYWDAETEHCPHKPIPEQGTDAWDTWMTLGHQPYDDGILCLSAPATVGCPACTAEHGETDWSQCHERSRTDAKEISPFPQHQPMTADAGPLECWDRECEEFFTEEGDEIPGMTTCSHIKQMEICAACSEPAPGEAEEFPAVVIWADCPVRKTPGQHAQGAS